MNDDPCHCPVREPVEKPKLFRLFFIYLWDALQTQLKNRYLQLPKNDTCVDDTTYPCIVK